MTGKKNFGFETHSGRQIDLDHTGHSLTDELDGVVGAWRACINCGSCTATCPAGFNFRKIHYQIKLSTHLLELPTLKRLTTELSTLPLELATLKSCFLCGKCQLVCPRGIPTRYLAIQITQKTKQYAEDIPSV